jgi:Putative metallopeptidase
MPGGPPKMHRRPLLLLSLLCLSVFATAVLHADDAVKAKTKTKVAAEAPAEEEEEEYSGTFSLVFQPAKKARNKPIEKAYRASKLFDATIEELNDTLALPDDLEIVFTECGTENAFYDSETTRVLMCYELIDFFQKQFSAAYDDKEVAEAAVMDSVIFIFHHELGHALVDLLEIPITGKEEDAVDDLATLVLLHEWEGGDESALSAAEAFYMIGEGEEEEIGDDIESLPYYGQHSLGKQRYYQIACTVFGFDPEAHAELIGDVLPKERAAQCQAEYQQKAKSWNVLLNDYYAAADDEEDDQ